MGKKKTLADGNKRGRSSNTNWVRIWVSLVKKSLSIYIEAPFQKYRYQMILRQAQRPAVRNGNSKDFGSEVYDRIRQIQVIQSYNIAPLI